MSLSQRLLRIWISAVFILVGFALAVSYAYLQIDTQFSRIESRASEFSRLNKDILLANADLIRAADNYLEKPTVENAIILNSHTDKSVEKLKKLTTSMRWDLLNIATDSHSTIMSFNSIALKIGARISANAKTVTSLNEDILYFKKISNKIPSINSQIETITDIYSKITSNILSIKSFNIKDLQTQIRTAENGLENNSKIPNKLKSKINDTLTDLSALVLTLDKNIASRSSEYDPKYISLLNIPSQLSESNDKEIVALASKSKNYLTIGFVLGLSIVISLTLLYLKSFRIIMKDWKQSVQSLNTLGDSILNGNVTIMDNSITNLSGATDEIGVALQALSHTLKELADLKESLEDRVEERTRSLEEAQNKLFQNEKMASLGTMAAGVAHELNNPLQIISLYGERLMSELTEVPNAKKSADKILNQISRMTRIIDQMKRLSQQNSTGPEPGVKDFNSESLIDLISNSYVLIEQKLKSADTQIIKNIHDINLKIFCDKTLFESVFTNLILNSLDAFSANKSRLSDKNLKIIISSFIIDDSLIISVTDNAGGIPEHILPNIFDPFFTTKGAAGTGLGLSIIYKTIKSLNGNITAKVKPNIGTTFIITLPTDTYVSTKSAA